MSKIENDRAITYVNFRKEAKYHYGVKQEEFGKMTECLDPSKMAKHKTLRSEWRRPGTWLLIREGDYDSLAINEGGRFHIYTCNQFDDEKNNGLYRHVGQDSRKLVDSLMMEQYGVDIKQAYGTCPRAMKDFVPKPVYFIDTRYSDVTQRNVWLEDYSSNYPAMGCGNLPTWEGHIEVDGEVEPTEEYPYAYYLGTNQYAEYGRVDSRKWSEYGAAADNVVSRMIPGKPAKTILCKASPYTMTKIWQNLYRRKKEGDPDAKIAMVSTIGTLHPDRAKFPAQYHVAATILSRAVQQHLDMYKRMTADGAIVYQMVVDSFIYTPGSVRGYGSRFKTLGGLFTEISGLKYDQTNAINQYVFWNKDGSTAMVKHGALVCTDGEFAKNLDEIRKKQRAEVRERWRV